MELRSLCADAGRDLTEEETRAAMKAIDENGNGYIEFNEFVAFWVNPSAKVAELKEVTKPADDSNADKSGASTQEKVGSASGQ
jgi:PBP1b-binding outer membrane lipoprotein LpoB